ncbi:MAG TPA: nickel pincer cofactor biosynthesis protein LarC [Calidithermus sp.]|nr:nickel pincer cofactor biosynthesis protein LarC [Calidithermus sp.]
MRVAYFDCPSGAAGDMIVAALLDAGAPQAELEDALRSLKLPGWRLEVREVRKAGFRARKVDVEVTAAGPHHRTLADILGILEQSALPAAVRARAARIFTRLAEAEARVHGTSLEHVHLHDVGAVDALVDVTGAVVALDLLGVETVHVSALPLGAGLVDGPHGPIPVPGPATAELVRGFPVVDAGVRAELLTPTGAAILTTLAAGAGQMPAMTVERVGYGAGTRDLPIPNVLRCFVGPAAGEAAGAERVVEVETTIDDMSPQLYEPVVDRLLEAGALDVHLTPVVMKRSRPGVVVSVLALPERAEDVARVLFEETPTLGVRWSERRRWTLPREVVPVTTGYGTIAVKVARLAGRVVTATPEFADVRRVARERGVPVREVLDHARAAARRLLDAPADRTG